LTENLKSRDPTAEARLRRLLAFHRINFHAFWISFVLGFGGLSLGLIIGEPAAYLMLAGFALMGLLLLKAYFVYPFLRCPICGNRFFLSNGIAAVFTKIDALQRSCIHCGASVTPR
jgi:hypothetical protein